jgi:hypothetical protein
MQKPLTTHFGMQGYEKDRDRVKQSKQQDSIPGKYVRWILRQTNQDRAGIAHKRNQNNSYTLA